MSFHQQLLIATFALVVVYVTAPVLAIAFISYEILLIRKHLYRNQVIFSKINRLLIFSILFQVAFFYWGGRTYMYFFGDILSFYGNPIVIMTLSQIAGVIFILTGFRKIDLNGY